MFDVGDKVAIKRKKSVKHFRANNMPITGKIVKVDEEYQEGVSLRPIKVQFVDGRESWWGRWELRKSR